MNDVGNAELIEILSNFTAVMQGVVIIVCAIICIRVGIHTERLFTYSVMLLLVSGASVYLFTSAPQYISTALQATGFAIALCHYLVKVWRGHRSS